MTILFNSLEHCYKNSSEVSGMQAGLQSVLDELRSEVYTLKKQRFINTATWGLQLWEWLFTGSIDDYSKKKLVADKILSLLSYPGGTCKHIKEIAARYAGCDASIITLNEHYADGIVTVVIPEAYTLDADSSEKLLATLRLTVPAHIDIVLEQNNQNVINTYASMENYTHSELEEYSHEQLEEGIEI